MKPVRQSIFPSEEHPYRGNCFAACLASLLEIPLDRAPHEMEHDDWRERVNAWLAGRNLGMVEIRLATDEHYLYPLPPGQLVIVSGRTVRHPSRLHAVVARTLGCGMNWEFLHDPHPDDSYLTEATHLMWLVPLDPAGAGAA